ncbi:MAG TPA: isochorismatase family cysteine hydrolase [Burkholderiales bacterium]|nr:isochorismatase family cysteine hydrolase [Burkholderiales bacterium]
MEKMAKRLHGAKPTKHRYALLLIDFINDLDFPSSARLLPQAIAAARETAALKARASRAGVPVIYVNDNFGRWQSHFEQVVAHCLRKGTKGREVTALVKPRKDDYFILKPRHSAFYQTPLPLLLEDLGAKNLILTGVLTDSCVLFSANDAYLRGYKIFVPEDCVASLEAQHTEEALDYMRRSLKADTRAAANIAL